jgi:hypothetical protein
MTIRGLLNHLVHPPGEAPSLYDLLPHADAEPRSMPYVAQVPASAIIGTIRRPSRTGSDFLPARNLRTAHWRDDWRRIQAAFDELRTLPAVELFKVGSCYFVIDGHKRVAAAKQRGADLDAVVTELHPRDRALACA